MIDHLTLTEETVRPLLALLQALAQEAEARRVALLHESGLVLAECGEDAHRDHGESGALAAGAFFAARHLAGRLGDESFAGLHYQGTTREFLLTAIGRESLLFIVFDQRTRPAIVRACVQKLHTAIEAATSRIHRPTHGRFAEPGWPATPDIFRESPPPPAADTPTILRP